MKLKHKVGIILDPRLHLKLRIYCVQNNIKMYEFVEKAIKTALDNTKEKSNE